MKEQTLREMPRGATGCIARCLSPTKPEVYRLLEMGLCKGTRFKVIRKARPLRAMEIALNGSRLCIAYELAEEFKVVVDDVCDDERDPL